jgi:hypothetical protein
MVLLLKETDGYTAEAAIELAKIVVGHQIRISGAVDRGVVFAALIPEESHSVPRRSPEDAGQSAQGT